MGRSGRGLERQKGLSLPLRERTAQQRSLLTNSSSS
jgi:hypothetical protein